MLASPSGQAVKGSLNHRAHSPHAHYSPTSLSANADSLTIYSGREYSPSSAYPSPTHEWPNSPGYPISLTNLDRSTIDEREDEDNDDAFTISTRKSSNHDDESFVVPNDDCVSFFSTPPTPTPVSRDPAVDGSSLSIKSNNVQEDDPHMSVLGPKMRFVSPAPWELDQDDVVDEDEENYGPADALSMFSGRITWKSREQDKPSSKGHVMPNIRSRSPASPAGTEPKASGRLTQEMQRDSPYSASYFKGASKSHSAIPNRFASPRSSESTSDSPDTFAYRLTDNRLGAVSPDSQDPLGQPFPTYPFPRYRNSSYPQDDTHSLLSNSTSSSFVHPYANPDLLRVGGSPSSQAATRQTHERKSDEQNSQGEYVRRASEPAASASPSRSSLRKTSAGNVPLPAMPSRKTMASHEEEEEMIPLAQPIPRSRTTSRATPPRSITPFADDMGGPLRKLISLEEARSLAQHKDRDSNSVSIKAMTSSPSSTLVAGLGLAPGVSPDRVVLNQGRSTTLPTPLELSESTSSPPSQTKPRQRTLSIGKHFSSGPSPTDSKNTVPVKTIKHKRSGFMKLFQSKEKDKEREKYPITDLPWSGPEPHRRSTSTPPRLHELGTSFSIPPVPSLYNINANRATPPSLSVVVTSPSVSLTHPQPIRHAQPPSPALSTPAPRRFGGPESSSSFDIVRPPASAPATHETFEGLSLRPVSTIFSAKFPELLSFEDPSPLMPSATISDIKSPATPEFSTRSNSVSTSSDYPPTPSSHTPIGPGIGASRDEMIAALQEQLSNTRKKFQRQIWELEGQVKDLKAENEYLRNSGDCETCGKAKRERRAKSPAVTSVVDRPRPKVGGINRTVFGGINEL
ncbi:hypothetical protein BU17DRAFT_83967 [Hysterangium stoloniferum]|nr:hypothetical protein BU17DRAFT_83967 [Hysterangium stoloniferum]